MYLTYEEYRIYGGTLDETTFTDFGYEVQAQIDWYTFNRLQNMDPVDERVKRCFYKLLGLVESVYTFQSGNHNLGDREILSQSNDGVTTQYNVLDASECVSLAKNEIKRVIQIYLGNVKDNLGRSVLYRGVYPNE